MSKISVGRGSLWKGPRQAGHRAYCGAAEVAPASRQPSEQRIHADFCKRQGFRQRAGACRLVGIRDSASAGLTSDRSNCAGWGSVGPRPPPWGGSAIYADFCKSEQVAGSRFDSPGRQQCQKSARGGCSLRRGGEPQPRKLGPGVIALSLARGTLPPRARFDEPRSTGCRFVSLGVLR